MKHTIKEIVKDNVANFSHYRAGVMYYMVSVDDVSYTFPVYLEDILDATLSSQEKALFLMRYIRKAMDEGTMVTSINQVNPE